MWWHPVTLPTILFFINLKQCSAYQSGTNEYWDYIQQVANAKHQRDENALEENSVRF